MISPSACILVGKVNKTHGLDGELSVSFFSDDLIQGIEPGSCLIFDMDGIYTPFFVRSARPRGSEALLLAFDDVADQSQAQAFVGKSVYAIDDSAAEEGQDEDDGVYAGQLIGYTAIDADTSDELGVISDIDESTANVLFIIDRKGGKGELRVPVVDEFIDEISKIDKTVSFNLPTGLLEL